MTEIIPFVAIAAFVYFFKNNRANNFLTGLIFVSFIFFGTNYTTFGLDFGVFRYLHRLIGVLAILLLIFKVFKDKEYNFKDPVPLILMLFFGAMLASFVNNEIFFEYYFHYVRNFIFISGIVLYLYYFIDNSIKLDEIMKLIILLTLIISLFAVFEVIQAGWSTRITLFFSNPNYLGAALLPGLACTFFSKSKYFWITAIIIIIAIFATGSRGAMVPAIFIFLTYLYYKRFKISYIVPFLIVMTIITTVFFDQIVTNKNKSGIRISLAALGVNILQDKPINGMGYGQFRKYYYKYIDDDVLKLNNSEFIRAIRSYDKSLSDETLQKEGIARNYEIMTHNDMLTIIVELGLIGLACTLFLFYKLYIELKRLLLYNRDDYFLSIALIGSSLLFSMTHNNMTSYIFWFVLFVPFIFNRNYYKSLASE